MSRPTDFVDTRVLPRLGPQERLLSQGEGINEIVTVTETPGKGRMLMTNGHPMSATYRFSQRYMRAIAHVPLLLSDQPSRVLVIGFGVGNTTRAATLHPSVTRVDVADLSTNVLRHASYFEDANTGVLRDPKVVIRHGRRHK